MLFFRLCSNCRQETCNFIASSLPSSSTIMLRRQQTTLANDYKSQKKNVKIATLQQGKSNHHHLKRMDDKNKHRMPENQQKHGILNSSMKLQEKLAMEHEQRLEQMPELKEEYEQFQRLEKFLDTNVFGQLEKERAIEDVEPSLEEEDLEEKLAQKEYEEIMLTEDRIRDPENEPDINEMETGEETASKPINRFRKIIIGDEFKDSDLTKPPSPENPHPFDPEKCPMPPTHSRSLAQFANFSPLLQLLLHLGVDLYQASLDDPPLGHILVNHVNIEEAKKKIYWLYKEVGIPKDELGSYLTRNPRFLVQSEKQLQSHLVYLQYRRFTRAQSRKLIVEYRYWLNHPIELIDGRLFWIQRQFQMNANELRMVIVKEPKLIAFGTGPIGGIVRSLNGECGFTLRQLKLILIRDPRLFLLPLAHILTSYNYLAFVMRVTNEQIVEYPSAMRCLISGLRKRHEYLFRLGKANYVPDTPDCISLNQILHPSDRHFAEKVARTTIDDYNKFLKQI